MELAGAAPDLTLGTAAGEPSPWSRSRPKTTRARRSCRAQVLQLASAPIEDPIASQTITVPEVISTTDPEQEVTFHVLALQRTGDATLLTLQMSSPEPVRFGPLSFTDATGPERELFGRFALDDTSSGTRYRPLSWLRPDTINLDPADGPPNSCICPYRSGTVFGPEPIVVDVLYGPLPDGATTVSLTGPHGLDLPDLPVKPADG